MAIQNFTRQVLETQPARFAEATTREQMLTEQLARYNAALANEKKLRSDAQSERERGNKAYTDALKQHKQVAALVVQGELEKTANPAKADKTFLTAGKTAITRNFLAQRALAARVQFEKLRFTGSATIQERVKLEAVVRLIRDMHNGKRALDAAAVLKALDVADELAEVRERMASTTLPNVVPDSLSPERTSLIAQTMNIHVTTPESSGQFVKLEDPRDRTWGPRRDRGMVSALRGLGSIDDTSGARYGMTMRAIGLSAKDSLAQSLGIPGAGATAFVPAAMRADNMEAVAPSGPTVFESAQGGAVPIRMPIPTMWGRKHMPPSVMASLPAKMQADTLTLQDEIGAGKGSSGGFSPFANNHNKVRAVASLQGLGALLGCDLAGTGCNLASSVRLDPTAAPSAASPEQQMIRQQAVTANGASTGDCDWLCQLGNAFGAVGPSVGGALVGAGGATAASGQTGEGIAMGLVGSGLSFFGSFFGGGAQPLPGTMVTVPQDTVFGLPTPVVTVGAIGLGGVILYQMLKK